MHLHKLPLLKKFIWSDPKDFGAPYPDNTYVLKLNKSLYGLKEATLSWFELILSNKDLVPAELTNVSIN